MIHAVECVARDRVELAVFRSGAEDARLAALAGLKARHFPNPVPPMIWASRGHEIREALVAQSRKMETAHDEALTLAILELKGDDLRPIANRATALFLADVLPDYHRIASHSAAPFSVDRLADRRIHLPAPAFVDPAHEPAGSTFGSSDVLHAVRLAKATPTQSLLVHLLSQGLGLAGAADQAGVTPGAARAQMTLLGRRLTDIGAHSSSGGFRIKP